MRINSKNRIIAILICICIFTIFILGTIYEVKETNHICSGHDCPICANIRQIENIIRQLSIGTVSVELTLFVFTSLIRTVLLSTDDRTVLTPVKLKVRMDN